MSLKKSTMDINKQWQKLEQANFNQTIKKEEIMKAIQLESTSTIAELKKRLGQKINWVIFFILLFIGVAAFNYTNTLIIALMGVSTLTYLVGYIMLKQEHRKLVSTELIDGTVLDGLKSNLKAIKSALAKERIFGLLGFPVMMIVGFSFNSFLKGSTISDVLESQYNLTTIIFFVALVLFLGFAAEKMNKMAFGEHITKLETQIRELERIS